MSEQQNFNKFNQKYMLPFIDVLERLSMKIKLKRVLNTNELSSLNILETIIPTFELISKNPHISLKTEELTKSSQLVLKFHSTENKLKEKEKEYEQSSLIEEEQLPEEVILSLKQTLEKSEKISKTQWYSIKEASDSDSDSDEDEIFKDSIYI